MKTKFRCDCPITTAIDIVGDKWTLVIIKQMLLEGKKTFKNFIESNEAVASNILTARLKMLEEHKIIRKEKLPNNKKSNFYILDKKGIKLIPIVIELTIWSYENLSEFNPEIITQERLEILKKLKHDKENIISHLEENYKSENWMQ